MEDIHAKQPKNLNHNGSLFEKKGTQESGGNRDQTQTREGGRRMAKKHEKPKLPRCLCTNRKLKPKLRCMHRQLVASFTSSEKTRPKPSSPVPKNRAPGETSQAGGRSIIEPAAYPNPNVRSDVPAEAKSGNHTHTHTHLHPARCRSGRSRKPGTGMCIASPSAVESPWKRSSKPPVWHSKWALKGLFERADVRAADS